MIHFVPASKSDAPYLAELEAEGMKPHATALWGHFAPVEISAFDLASTRIIHDAGQQVGFLMVERADDHLRLRKMYLAPTAQGKGIGTEVLAMARAEAQAEGLPLRLAVLKPNQRALAFYLREGLQVEEVTPEQVFLLAS